MIKFQIFHRSALMEFYVEVDGQCVLLSIGGIPYDERNPLFDDVEDIVCELWDLISAPDHGAEPKFIATFKRREIAYNYDTTIKLEPLESEGPY